MEPHNQTNQRNTGAHNPATLASSKGAAQTVPDELKQVDAHLENPPIAGAVVDPAEVLPPVVPARRGSSKRWTLAVVLVVCVATVIILVMVYGR